VGLPPVPTAEQVRELERQRLATLVAPIDLGRARALHAPDYELIPPGGTPISRDAYLQDLESGALTYEVFEAASEPRVRVFAGGAVVRYRARIIVRGAGWVDEALVWHTDLWAYLEGRWQAVWSQATRISAEREA
jgi:hypothetical protein